MKNKLNIIKIIIFLILINFNFSQSIANDIIIDAQEVDIKEKGNLIVASGSVNIKDGNNVEITGDEVKYNKINQVVEVEGSVIFFDRAKNGFIKSFGFLGHTISIKFSFTGLKVIFLTLKRNFNCISLSNFESKPILIFFLVLRTSPGSS